MKEKEIWKNPYGYEIYYPYWSIISSASVKRLWLSCMAVLIHFYWTTDAELTEADVDITTCRTRLLRDFPYVACQHNMCSSFSKMQFLELRFIFLELVLSSSPQNQFSKVANTTSIKTDIFASGVISLPITEKLCCRFFKIMPSEPSNSNIQLHDEKWVWFYVPYS